MIVAVLLFVSACGAHEVSSGPVAQPAAAAPVAPALDVAAPASTTGAAAPASGPAGPVVAEPPAPAQPLTRTTSWPFVAWDRAEAVTYNHVAYGPGIALRAFDDVHGWSPKLVERRPVTRPQGERAVQWVLATGGEVVVSKCAFPRHAVVLFAGDTPVGSVNVCFECGDILVWPDLDPPPDDEHSSAAAQKQHERSYRRKLAAYKRVFPAWERFFRDELGLPLAPVIR